MPGAGRQGRQLTDTVDLRVASLADAPAVAAVHRDSRAAYYGTRPDPDDGREAIWAHLLAEPGTTTWLAEHDGELRGFVSVTRVVVPEPALELTALYVRPGHFGEGVGPRLHEVYLDARRPGEAGVLEVWAGNDRAIGFYERRGWIRTPRSRPGPAGHDYVTHRLPA